MSALAPQTRVRACVRACAQPTHATLRADTVHPNAVCCLLPQSKESIDASMDVIGRAELSLAASTGNLAVVQELRRSKAPVLVNAADVTLSTALHCAAFFGEAECLQVCVAAWHGSV